jgi:hypothetical protein
MKDHQMRNGVDDDGLMANANEFVEMNSQDTWQFISKSLTICLNERMGWDGMGWDLGRFH